MLSGASRNNRNRGRQYRNFLRFIKDLGPKKAIILCHRSADPDSYLSSYALSILLRKISFSDVRVGLPSGANELVKRLMGKYKLREGKLEEKYDIYFAVDVGDVELLAEWKEKFVKSKNALIDHHPHNDLEFYDLVLLDENAVSTSELVLMLYEISGIRPTRLAAQAMLDAIIYDSQNLAIATENTLFSSVKLISFGASLGTSREEVRSERGYDEAVARLKSAMRMKISNVKGFLVAFTRVNSFQAQCARALVHLGADLAFAAGETDDTTRVSIRSTESFYKITKIHLGNDISHVLALRYKGTGGGHNTAASLTCCIPVDEVLSECRKLTEKLLSSEMKELR
jgi:phosphoesterase RecJ-like protein